MVNETSQRSSTTNRYSFYLLLSFDSDRYKTGMLPSVGGVMVSIVAFQAMDPGSIPGRRTLFETKFSSFFGLFHHISRRD